MRKEVTAQMPGLKKQNLKASDYAKRTIQQLFEPDIVKKSLVKKVNISASVIAINNGGGSFSIVEMPDRVQWSCVCGISCTDVNSDGITDLVMGGNFYEMKPQFSRQDASYGHVLIGNGKSGFDWKTYNETGFFIRDEVRHMTELTDRDGSRYLIAVINNAAPRVFKLNTGSR
jgi:hypothetical protein